MAFYFVQVGEGTLFSHNYLKYRKGSGFELGSQLSATAFSEEHFETDENLREYLRNVDYKKREVKIQGYNNSYYRYRK